MKSIITLMNGIILSCLVVYLSIIFDDEIQFIVDEYNIENVYSMEGLDQAVRHTKRPHQKFGNSVEMVENLPDNISEEEKQALFEEYKKNRTSLQSRFDFIYLLVLYIKFGLLMLVFIIIGSIFAALRTINRVINKLLY